MSMNFEHGDFYQQYPLPPNVRMVMDYTKIDDHKWCLVLNAPFSYNPIGLRLDLTPVPEITYKIHVEEVNGPVLVAYDEDHYLPFSAIVGSLVLLPNSFPTMESFLSFIDQREHGCYITAKKEIFKTYNITDYTLIRY